MNSRNQSYVIYLLLFVAIIVMAFYSFSQRSSAETLTINQIAADIKAGKISEIEESEDRLRVKYLEDAREGLSTKESTATLVEQLLNFGVTQEDLNPDKIRVVIKAPSAWVGVLTALGWILPFLFLGGAFFFIFRQAQGSNNAAMSFGKSKARMFTGDHPTVTFADVAGVEEAKEELNEVVEFLREPQKFISLGARIPKGVLLVGPPGTGKTLLAKAVSGEAGVPFFSISGSEFVEMFVGVGASRVRDLFEQAKRHSPCIVFVDEIDAVGRQRGAGLGGSHDEREQTLNQMLVEMDGFDTDTNIIIMAATNRPDILDPALLRPGRFDRRVVLDRPDVRGREAILRVHVRGKPLEDNIDLSVIARSTPGFVGADLENLVNEAAILAARRNKTLIGQSEFEESIERVIAGPERKSRLISQEEKRIVAYHEAGHAVVMHVLPHADPVQKVSIISRGMAAGYTLALPMEDRLFMAKKKMLADMIGLLGGRAAEELVFDDITSGASNDIERVSKIARTMVMRMGMSEKLGPMVYGQKEELIFLGREISEQRDYSETVAEKIDVEVRSIVSDSYQEAKRILTEFRENLDAVATKLLEVETLSKDEFEKIFPSPFPKKSGTPELQID
ncbi:MAG: ATP-dependent zinc metalloprotease FtsH [Anaerolineaceae bacterium]|nr:ATP-dependent zinc metalloprotease FtsH [Anaerolineaceae bacterium]